MKNRDILAMSVRMVNVSVEMCEPSPIVWDIGLLKIQCLEGNEKYTREVAFVSNLYSFYYRSSRTKKW